MTRLKIQSLLYENSHESLDKFFDTLLLNLLPSDVEILLEIGDCSPAPVLAGDYLAKTQTKFAASKIELNYIYFGENLGFSKGHNRLFFAGSRPDLLLVINPDTILPYHLLERLVAQTKKFSDWGIIETRQIPLEHGNLNHAKSIDPNTLEETWATGACILCDVATFEQCQGFDEQFFMYCEDVDFSWRVRATGKKVYFATDTFIYHAKRLNSLGTFVASDKSVEYANLSMLILYHKYRRTELEANFVHHLENSFQYEPASRILSRWNEIKNNIKPLQPKVVEIAVFTNDGWPL